jgi:hypothetical protein
VTRLQAGWLRFNPWQDKWRDFFSSPPHPDWLFSPPNLLSGALSPGVKWLGHVADNSSPSRAEVNNTLSCTSTPSIHLHGMVINEAQGPLYLNLTVEGPSHDGRRPFLPGVDDLSHELRPESNPLSSLPKKPSGRVHTPPPTTPALEVIENQVDFWPLPGTPLVKDQVQVLRITPSCIICHRTHIHDPVIISYHIDSPQ